MAAKSAVAAGGAIDLLSVSGGTGATRLSTAYFVPPDELPEGVYNALARRWQWTISRWKNQGLNAEQAAAQASGDDERVERGVEVDHSGEQHVAGDADRRVDPQPGRSPVAGSAHRDPDPRMRRAAHAAP